MTKSKLEMNMLRERANPLPNVTEEMFKACNCDNVDLIVEYLQTSTNLSKQTLKQYKSGLYQFTYYIYENLSDKPFYRVTKRDFRRYMSYLTNRGLSSSALKFKKSSVSAFCKYIENVIAEEEPDYKTFRNFTTGVTDIPKNQVYSKLPITKEEYDKIMRVLKKNNMLLEMAWVATAFNCGCRRSELVQLRTEILNYDMNGKNYIISHKVRGKGRGIDGKVIEYMIPEEALKHIKNWVKSRGYEHEYIFTVKHHGNIVKMSPSWANRFCSEVLSEILGRRVNAHILKSSCITNLLNQGKSMATISKYVAQHESIETTQNFYDLRDDSDEKDNIFG